MPAQYRTLFKPYDIRGSGALFDDDCIVRLAYAFAKLYQPYPGQTLTIGYDARPQSRYIALIFLAVLQNCGIRVLWLGLVTTPMVVFFAQRHTHGLGIAITASHSPKDILGIKWFLGQQAADSQHVYDIFCQIIQYPKPTLPPEPCRTSHQEYVDALFDVFKPLHPTPVTKTLVIDCLHGAAGVIAALVFETLGYKCIMLNNNPDGTFPNGNPDPAEPGRLHQLQQAVIAHQANLGLAFDGDGDRLAVVDEGGAIVAFDWLILLLIRATINSPKTAIFDIKCNHVLPKILQSEDIRCIWAQTGSTHLRRLLKTKYPDAGFAGELSGHFIFNDGLFVAHDDGIYAAVRLLAYLKNNSLSSILSTLPCIITTPDLYIRIPKNISITPKQFIQKISEYIQNNPQNCTVCLIDGVRLDFDYGFCIIRASNTSDCISIRAGADTQDDFLYIINILQKYIQNTDFSFHQFSRFIHKTLLHSVQENTP